MSRENAVETIASFDIEMTEDMQRAFGDVEDYEAFTEWLEKTSGNFEQAINFYPLPVDMKADKDTLESLLPWHAWRNFEPHDPPRFNCPICRTEFIQVESADSRYAGYGAVNQFTGHMTGTQICSDENGMFYDETEEHDTICGDCERDMRRQQPSGESTLRVFRPDDNDTLIYFENGVRFDNGTISSEFSEYSDLPRYMQEAVSDVVAGRTVRNMNETTAGTQGFTRSFTRRGFNQYVHSMVHDPDEWHFDFPLLAVGKIRHTAEIAGGYLYTPRLERYDGALEEVESWVDEEKMNEFRRDRM